jgi:plasmid replication initiation protein
MLPSKWKKIQAEKLANQKSKPHQKISNNFIENAIKNNTIGAIKTVYYLASIIEQMTEFKAGQEKGMLKIEIDRQQMLKYTELTLPEIRRNLKAMQETSITFINEVEQWEEGISLLPYYKFVYGKGKIHIEVYQKIANLIVEVKSNYTMVNTKQLMELKSKHSLRLLPLLQKISKYDEHVGKRTRMDLEDLNTFFGTKYKKIADIERFILMPVKEELDSKSNLTFMYEVNFIQLDKGRPKAHNITIDVVERKNYQGRLL